MKPTFKDFLKEQPDLGATQSASPTPQAAVDPHAQQLAQRNAAMSQQVMQLQQQLMQKETAKSRLDKEIFDLKKKISMIEITKDQTGQM